MQEITIQNLKCGGCASTISKKISSMDCVNSVEVNIANSSVMVELKNPSQMNEVKEKLSSLGYPEETEANSLRKKAKSMLSCSVGKITQ